MESKSGTKGSPGPWKAVPRSPAFAELLLEALRDTVSALEAAGADGEPGAMPSPALDRARLLLSRLNP
jgi:hypothetical protein